MFFIRSKEGNTIFYILENNTYVVGRKDCNILLTGDNSISRKHASITIEENCITIKDLGAKYKTFINDEELESLGSRRLVPSDVIKFGILKNIFTVEEMKINTTCSALKNDEKQQLKQCLQRLDGKLHQNWSKDCTHLTVREIILTTKVLCALIEGQIMVTLQYWIDLVKKVESNLPLPLAEDYKPICVEKILNQNINFKYNPLRKTLFANKVFVFLNDKDRQTMEDLIKLAGGRSISWNKEPISQDDISSTRGPDYVLIQDTNTQTKGFNSYNKILDYLSEIGKRSIPQQEIAIAILTCSCEKDCNPNFSRSNALFTSKPNFLLQTQDVLAENTPSQYFSAEDYKPSLVIPQSDEVDHFRAPVTSTQIENDNDLSLQKEFIDKIEETCIKREGEPLEKENNSKKIKFDRKHPFGLKRATSTQNRSSQINKTSSVDLFNLQSQQSIIDNISPIKFANPLVPSRKRSCDETQPAKIAKRALLNPFATTSSKPKSSPKTISLFKTPNSTGVKIRTTTEMTNKFVAVKLIPPPKGVRIDTQFERTIPWISKNTTAGGGKENLNTTDTLSNFINSFRDCVIVKTLPLIIKKVSNNISSYNKEDVVNYKKFKKVQPRHVQTFIIPKAEFKTVVCNDSSYYDD